MDQIVVRHKHKRLGQRDPILPGKVGQRMRIWHLVAACGLLTVATVDLQTWLIAAAISVGALVGWIAVPSRVKAKS